MWTSTRGDGLGPSAELIRGRSVQNVAQRTILVADDDASIRSLLKQLLSYEGYSVTEAATGTNGPSGQVRERTHAKRVDTAAEGESVETPNKAAIL